MNEKYAKGRAQVFDCADELDKIRPGWEHEINTGTLDLDSCTRCIFGQLYGHCTKYEDWHSFFPKYNFALADNQHRPDWADAIRMRRHPMVVPDTIPEETPVTIPA